MDTLQAAHYLVYQAADAPSGLARAHELHPPVILIDLLSDPSAWETIGRFQADPATADIPILLVHTQNAFPLGPSACVARPAQRDELLAALARIQREETANPVLIVDDNEGERDMLCTFMHAENFPVEPCQDSALARDWLADHVPGLIFIDLDVPEGIETSAHPAKRSAAV